MTIGTGTEDVPCGTFVVPVLVPGSDGEAFDELVSFNCELLGDPLSASVADMLLGTGANDGLPFGLHTLVMAMVMPGVTKLRVASFFVMPLRG